MSRRRPSNTKAERVRRYLRKHPNATRAECIKAIKENVHTSQYSTLIRQMADEAYKHQKKQKGDTPLPPIITDEEAKVLAKEVMGTGNGNGNGASTQIVQDLEKRVDEYRYRCWLLEGEKFDYVTRLLSERVLKGQLAFADETRAQG